MEKKSASLSGAGVGSVSVEQATDKNLNDMPTPVRERATDDAQKNLRTVIAAQMKEETVYCELDDFIGYYFLPIPSEDEMKALCLNSGIRHLLRTFSTPPKEAKANWDDWTENAYFLHMQLLGASISENSGTSNGFTLSTVPTMRSSSNVTACSIQMDACIMDATALHTPGKLHTTDIAVPFAFTIDDYPADREENRLQLVSSVVHIMNADMRRNFIYAVTIENDRVSLWYFSRTHSVKSTSFSFVQHPKTFLRVLRAFLTANREELGYDPRITMLNDGKFVYETPPDAGGPSPRLFLVKNVVSESRELRLSSRTSRILKAVEVDSEGKPKSEREFILKDAWIDASARTEAQIQKDILGKIEDFSARPEGWRTHPLLEAFDKGPIHRSHALAPLLEGGAYRNLFLKATTESVGETCKAIHDKAWDSDEIYFFSDSPIDMEDLSGNGQRLDPTNPGRVSAAATRGGTRGGLFPTTRAFTPRKRCLFLYGDVCERVSCLPTLGAAMDVLRQATLGLILMFCAGWVHCDISDGNILAVWDSEEQRWQVRISDLEYARPFPRGEPAGSDPRTGTPFFMAIERHTLESLYVPPLQNFLKPGQDEVEDCEQDVVKHPQMHSYQHDLESVWWLILWLVLTRTNYPTIIQATIFREASTASADRRQVFMQGFMAGGIGDSFHPDAVELKRELEKLRIVLHSTYRQRPPNRLQDLETYSTLCVNFVRFFDNINEPSRRAMWSNIPLLSSTNRERVEAKGSVGLEEVADEEDHALAPKDSKKRKRDGSNGDGGLPEDSTNNIMGANQQAASPAQDPADADGRPKKHRPPCGMDSSSD